MIKENTVTTPAYPKTNNSKSFVTCANYHWACVMNCFLQHYLSQEEVCAHRNNYNSTSISPPNYLCSKIHQNQFSGLDLKADL